MAAMTYLDRPGDETATDQEAVTLATAPVEQRDLQEEIEWAGTLGYGQPLSVTGGGGTVTAVPEAGVVLGRGDTVAWVDDQPVVALFGQTPMWRTIGRDDEGADVLQLEANLAALGFDPDATVDVDGVFTANTEAMVERWQEDLGREITGVVTPDDVVVIEGPSSLVSVTDVGSSATGELAVLAPRRAVTDVVAGVDGTITGLAPIGSPVESGQTLFLIDEVPVVALDPIDRVAEVLLSDTFTIVELEQALTDEGHDPDGEMTIDGTATGVTETVIERWQQANGLPVTGLAEPAWYVPTPSGQSIDAHLVADGTDLSTGGPVLTTSASRLSVEVVVDVAESDEFSVGQSVTIELADESTAAGLVAEIGAVSQPAQGGQGDPTQTIVIDVVTGDDASLVEGTVIVVSIGEEVVGATVVPTRALVALAEGGFAIEKVVGDGATRLIAVEIGTFDDGVVEITDGEVSPGDEVVVPQ